MLDLRVIHDNMGEGARHRRFGSWQAWVAPAGSWRRVGVGVDLELQQLDLRYESLRVRCPAREARLLALLAEGGQQTPIVVVAASGQRDRYVVIDGFRRIRALRRLGQDVVRATEWAMGEVEALLMSRSLRTGDGETALEQAWLVRELSSSFGMSHEEVARSLGRSASWVSRRLSLVAELPEIVQDRVRRGDIGAHAAMRCLAPMARATRKDCEALAEAIAGQKLSSREVARLYEAWRDAGPVVRRRVIAEPWLYLKVSRQATAAGATVGPAEALLADLETAAAAVRRVVKAWGATAAVLRPREQRAAEVLVRQAAADLGVLEGRIGEGLVDAHEADTSGDSGAGLTPARDAGDRPRPRRVARRCEEGHRLTVERGAVDRAERAGDGAP